MALADSAALAVTLTLDARQFTGPLRNVQRQLGSLNSSMGRVGKGFGQIGTGIARAGLVVGGAAVTGIAAAAKAAVDYEDAFAGVRKTVEATEPQLSALSDQFRELAKTIPIPATEFARLGEIAGALGIHVQSIDEFAEVTAKLGVTTDLTADQAADALGRIGNILNLTADDYDNFGSALVRLGNEGASFESEIIEITKRFAAAGKQAGLSAIEILGFAEAAASFTGLQQEAAGSSLSRLLGTLTKVAASGGKKFKVLNKVVGEDFRKALDRDAGDAVLGFLEGLEELDKYERANVLKELGLDSVYLRQLLGGLVDNIDDVRKSLDNADQGWRGNFLNEEAAKKFETLAQQFQVLRNNVIDAGITIGTEFLPALKRTTDKLIAFLKQPGNQDVLKSIGRDIGRTIDSIDWAKVVDGAKSFVGTMKGALDVALQILRVIDKLPAELKTAGLGFLALNKLSGGLVAAGVGNIFGGLAEAIARSLGSQLPGVGKLFVQPVLVTNWPAGGLGGAAVAPGGGGLFKSGVTLGSLVLIMDGISKLPDAFGNFTRSIEAASEGNVTGYRNALNDFVANAGGWLPFAGLIDAFKNAIPNELTVKPNAVVPVKPQGMSPDERQEAADKRARMLALDGRLEATKTAIATRVDTMRTSVVAGGHSDADRVVNAIGRMAGMVTNAVHGIDFTTAITFTGIPQRPTTINRSYSYPARGPRRRR